MALTDYIRAMPKAELHVHLEGSIKPETVFELSKKNGVTLPVSSVEELKAWYKFRNFDHFVEIYLIICSCLKTPDDFTRIVYEFGQNMARQNIRYAEVTWTPHTHVNGHLSFETLLESINRGRDQAQREWGVEMRWIPDIARCFPDTTNSVVQWLTAPAAQEGGVVALGLGGPEVGWPPEMFEAAFTEARAKGLHSNPHAGETVGPSSVWGSIRALKAERLGHGVRSIEDPELLDYLVKHQVPLEVNPTSNLCLGVYPSYPEHPLRYLVEKGVYVTINSDDPALFNTSLTDEYIHAVMDCDLTVDQLEHAVLNAIRASYLPDSKKTDLIGTFEADFKRLRKLYNVE
jgi:adenosine deaminase